MTLKRILVFAAIVEIVTGLALLFVTRLVIELLLGVYAPWTALSIARVAGIAVLTLGVSCTSWRESGPPRAAPWLAMLTYNVLVAAYLAYLSVVGGIGGVMLWPAAVLHAIVAVALAWLGRGLVMPASGAHGE